MNHKEIVDLILTRQGHTLEQIKEKNREHNLVFTKKMIGYFLKTYTKMSLNQIADEYFNGKHCRVLYYEKEIKTFKQYPKAYRAEVNIVDEFEKIINPDINQECRIVTVTFNGNDEFRVFTDTVKLNAFLEEHTDKIKDIIPSFLNV